MLKYAQFEDEKIFVVVSTCLTWNKNVQKSDEVYSEKDAPFRRG